MGDCHTNDGSSDCMFIYIYISFLNYTLNFGLVETAISEETPAIGNNVPIGTPTVRSNPVPI